MAPLALTACGERVPAIETSVSQLVAEGCIQDTQYHFEGFATKIGERTSLVAYPYFDPATKTTKISLSEIVETTYAVHADADSESTAIKVLDRNGGLYLPIPYSPASGSNYGSKVDVVGRGAVDDQGSCTIKAETITSLE
jgi:hypothetical protein